MQRKIFDYTPSKSPIDNAISRLREIKASPLGIEERIEIAQDLAALILESAKNLQTSKEKKRETELAKMIRDPNGKAFVSAMLDSSFRTKNPQRLLDQIQFLLTKHGMPSFMKE